MRRIILSLMLPAACISMHAETTGRISGKVVNKAGNPVPGAKLKLQRTDINWSKDLVADKNGKFLQVGLEPKDMQLTVSAEGYIEQKEFLKIPLGDVLVKNFTLLTPEEARTQAIGLGTATTVVEDPSASLDAAGREAFNLAIPFYNRADYASALPLIEKAYKNLSEVQEKAKDAQAKAELAPELVKMERLLGICLAQAGAKKEDGEPFLLKALERNPKDERVVASLIATSKAKDDKVAVDKYTAMLETIQGPNADLTYNKAVEAFNDVKTKEAKALLNKTLEIDAKHAEAHFLMAMVAFGENNLKATKHNLQKYVELAPTGKNAATAKEMLKDPSLKNIK